MVNDKTDIIKVHSHGVVTKTHDDGTTVGIVMNNGEFKTIDSSTVFRSASVALVLMASLSVAACDDSDKKNKYRNVEECVAAHEYSDERCKDLYGSHYYHQSSTYYGSGSSYKSKSTETESAPSANSERSGSGSESMNSGSRPRVFSFLSKGFSGLGHSGSTISMGGHGSGG